MTDQNNQPNDFGQPAGLPPKPNSQYPMPAGFSNQAVPHPEASSVLIWGIVTFVVCQLLSPVAWVKGNRVLKEIDQSLGQVGGRDHANIGRILGIIGTVIMVLYLLLIIFGLITKSF